MKAEIKSAILRQDHAKIDALLDENEKKLARLSLLESTMSMTEKFGFYEILWIISFKTFESYSTFCKDNETAMKVNEEQFKTLKEAFKNYKAHEGGAENG